MKVKELIDRLSDLDPEIDVFVEAGDWIFPVSIRDSRLYDATLTKTENGRWFEITPVDGTFIVFTRG